MNSDNDSDLIKELNKFRVMPHYLSGIKKIIGVMSGKGGVGKSLVTSLLAVTMQKKGYKTAILDADITGASIPKIFGMRAKAQGSKEGIFPIETKSGIKIISSNLLLPSATDPVIWRGPLIANLVRQFWTNVVWQNVDYMFVDLPPGTGDVPLTVFQSLPLDGIILVFTPQDLVSMIVEKALKMAKTMNIPILGVVENMSYVTCPKCGEKIFVFGESKIKEIAATFKLKVLAQIPFEPLFSSLCDQGKIEDLNMAYLGDAITLLEELPLKAINCAVPIHNDQIDTELSDAEIFYIYQIVKRMVVGHTRVVLDAPDDILKVLAENKVRFVLCDKAASYLTTCLKEKKIRVFSGFSGDPTESLRHFLREAKDLL